MKFNFYHLNRAGVACRRFHGKIMMNQYITVQGKTDYLVVQATPRIDTNRQIDINVDSPSKRMPRENC